MSSGIYDKTQLVKPRYIKKIEVAGGVLGQCD
jgi:hypothetical protein